MSALMAQLGDVKRHIEWKDFRAPIRTQDFIFAPLWQLKCAFFGSPEDVRAALF